MEQDMNLDNTAQSEDISIMRLLRDITDPAPVASPQPVTTQDVNEKMAINAIQRQLMSFEVPGNPAVPRNNVRFPQPSSMPAVMTQNQVLASSYSQVNQYQATAPPAYTISNPGQRTRAPGIHNVQNNVNMVPSQQLNNQRQSLSQYGGLTNLNDLSPQVI